MKKPVRRGSSSFFSSPQPSVSARIIKIGENLSMLKNFLSKGILSSQELSREKSFCIILTREER